MVACRVPTSRRDEIVRDASAGVSSGTGKVWSWLLSVLVAGVAAGVANELSDSTALVIIVTMAGLVVGYGVAWLWPLVAAVRKPHRRRHWLSQVYQAAPECVEFDLWSECAHEVAALRVRWSNQGEGSSS